MQTYSLDNFFGKGMSLLLCAGGWRRTMFEGRGGWVRWLLGVTLQTAISLPCHSCLHSLGLVCHRLTDHPTTPLTIVLSKFQMIYSKCINTNKLHLRWVIPAKDELFCLLANYQIFQTGCAQVFPTKKQILNRFSWV